MKDFDFCLIRWENGFMRRYVRFHLVFLIVAPEQGQVDTILVLWSLCNTLTQKISKYKKLNRIFLYKEIIEINLHF